MASSITPLASISSSVILNSGEQLIVSPDSPKLTEVIVSSGGELILRDYSMKTTVFSGGNVIVSSGGWLTPTTIYSGGNVTVSSAGAAYPVTISSGGNLTLLSGGYANQTTIYSGGNLTASSDGSSYHAAISSSGNLTILSGGSAQYAIVSSGGNVVVSSGGVTNQMSIMSGGNVSIEPGSIIQSTQIMSSASLSVLSERNIVSTKVWSKGSLTISSGGSADQTQVGDYGGLTVLSGAHVTNTSTGFLGSITVSSGASINQTTVGYNSDVIILSGAVLNNATVNNAGRLTIASGGKNNGTISANANGSLIIYPDAGGTIELLGDPHFVGDLQNAGVFISGLENGGVVTTVINNFIGRIDEDENNDDYLDIASDYIIMPGVKTSDVTNVSYEDANGNANGDYITLSLNNGNKIVMNIPGIESEGYNLNYNADGDLYFEVCFLAGSMIKTPKGEVAVEDLRIGDKILTFNWQQNKEEIQSVRWVGNKAATVNPTRHDDEAGYPVRILKDAIAEGVPSKDLLITPEHCLFFDGKFTPARMLVNGYSIYYDYSITNYTYYHIETESHAVIWANGMLTESYLDTGNQTQFKQHGEFAILTRPTKPKTWEQDAAAPLMVDRSYVEPIHHTLQQRAIKMKMPMMQEPKKISNDPHFHLATPNGLAIESISNFKGQYVFLLPTEGVDSVYLVSKTSRLNDVIGPFEDNRHELGVLVGNIQILSINSAYNINISNITDHLTHPDLSGWHTLEQTPCRWTKGKALLNIPKNNNQEQRLIINIISDRLYTVDEKQEKLIAV
ncbi:Hint domain-containing protein [Commensalibacter intestini]|nr:Hint domain-containing protein [Commensalibacter intestini]